MSDFLTGDFKALKSRALTEEACRKYGYSIGKDARGNTVQIANYRRDGRLVFQKIRGKDKDFYSIGEPKESGLYGQHLYQPGRRLVITEGELDAISVAQAMGLKWPVVSIPKGAKDAAKSIGRELEWVEGFDEVVLMFDNDEPGREAAQAVAAILTPGKAKIAELPRKDASDMLQAGEADQIVTAVFQAQIKRPDGIVTFGQMRDRALTPMEIGMPWKDERLTKLTFGKRYGEVYAFGAGTGVGKTDYFMEEAEFTAHTTGQKVALFYLEQPPAETAKRLAGKFAGRRFHVPDGSWEPGELVNAFDKIDATGNVFLYDHFGSSDWEVVLGNMRHLVVAEGVKHIFLDHLTAFAAEADDEKKMLEMVTAQIAKFAMQYQVCFYFISHLATPEGKPHEEGGRVMIRHFKGSRSIGFWAHGMFGLERNQQAETEQERQLTTFRVLKDRYTGQATGKCLFFGYDHDRGLLVPCEEPSDDEPFSDGGSDGY